MIGLRPYIYGGLAIFAALALFFTYRQGQLNERAKWEEVQRKELVARAVQQKKNDDQTALRYQLQKEIAENAVKERDQARADSASASAVGERLRAQIRNVGMSVALRDPQLAGSGEAAAEAIRVLSELQRGSDETADAIARYADEAGAAGRACEASYAALISRKD